MTEHRQSSSVEAHLPLKPVVLQILLALAEQDLHGYGVIQAVRERSEGRIHLETGPFYRHLRKLMDGGLVRESPARPDEDDPRRGSYYRLTGFGREVVGAEVQRLATLVSAGEELGLTGRNSSK
jgi:DNA-binding PadR family transcriptional regulator